jgi:hypothetical protein
LVNICVFGFAFRTGLGAAGNPEEGVAGWGNGRGRIKRFEASGGFAAMGKHESLALGNPAQHSFGMLPKLQHAHRFHDMDFKLKLMA